MDKTSCAGEKIDLLALNHSRKWLVRDLQRNFLLLRQREFRLMFTMDHRFTTLR